MPHDELLRQILDRGLMAILRTPDGANLVELSHALVEAGISTIEVTLTIPDGFAVLSRIKASVGPRVIIGAGTVLDGATARMAIAAGADFLVSPTFDTDVIHTARRFGKLSMPGAFTPTEILAAWQAGADIVKIFPAEVLGPAFFQAVLRPLPQLRIMPTGGVDLTSAAKFLQAGASCLGIGGPLCDPSAVASRAFGPIQELARKYVDLVRQHRAGT